MTVLQLLPKKVVKAENTSAMQNQHKNHLHHVTVCIQYKFITPHPKLYIHSTSPRNIASNSKCHRKEAFFLKSQYFGCLFPPPLPPLPFTHHHQEFTQSQASDTFFKILNKKGTLFNVPVVNFL